MALPLGRERPPDIRYARNRRGKPLDRVKSKPNPNPTDRGSLTSFRFDDTIFKELSYSYDTLLNRFREQAYLTHMSHEMDHETLCRHLPARVRPAYDGLSFEF